MSAPVLEGFPFTPLDESQVEAIYSKCGGDEPALDKLRVFLGREGFEALPESWFRLYLQDLGLTCLESLDVEVADPAARENLNRGLLFYAATFRTLGAAATLPHDREVLESQKQKDKTGLGISARQDIEDIPAFCELFGRFRKDFGKVGNRPGFDVALLGAGLAHIITTESAQEDPIDDGRKPDAAALERGVIANLEMKALRVEVPDVVNDRRLHGLPFRAAGDTRPDLGALPEVVKIDRRKFERDSVSE